MEEPQSAEAALMMRDLSGSLFATRWIITGASVATVGKRA